VKRFPVDFDACMAHDDLAMHYALRLCMLAGYRDHVCSDEVDLHHMVRKGFSEPELIAVVCHTANVARLADEKEARRILVQLKVQQHGADHMRAVLANRGLDLDSFL
jgi:hypothetical protein